jgi:hypothetical protein
VKNILAYELFFLRAMEGYWEAECTILDFAVYLNILYSFPQARGYCIERLAKDRNIDHLPSLVQIQMSPDTQVPLKSEQFELDLHKATESQDQPHKIPWRPQ